MKQGNIFFFILITVVVFCWYSCTKDEEIDLNNVISIEISPGDTVIEVGKSVQFKAIGLFPDSSYKDITRYISWVTNDASKLSIDENGLATAITEGDFFVVGATTTTYTTAILISASSEELIRKMVLADYETNYNGSAIDDCGWTGNTSECDRGTVSQDSHKKVVQRINYFRRLCGLPDNIHLDAAKNSKCQAAALIIKANSQLNHYPIDSTTLCWTQEGYDGSANSNLSLGFHSVNAITAFIDDDGKSNKSVRHRRWLLYTRGSVMGHGSTDSSCAIWVIQGNVAVPSGLPEFISYPPKGYVPAPLVFKRWSFSIPGADFSNAGVVMKDSSNNEMQLSVISRTDSGMGDNSIVWEPADINITSQTDISYSVELKNVVINGSVKTFNYTVTIIQPDKNK